MGLDLPTREEISWAKTGRDHHCQGLGRVFLPGVHGERRGSQRQARAAEPDDAGRGAGDLAERAQGLRPSMRGGVSNK
jgi:hypothetical protein